MDLKQFVMDAVEAKKDLVIDVNDQIFDFAEIGFREHRSADLLCDVLAKEGFTVEHGVAGMPTAFVATYGSGKPAIGFLAEYDALPELSQVGGCCEKIKAEGDNPDGHGCGHNLLGAGTLASALAVKAYLDETGKPGTVILFGCPSEEKGDAKAIMAREHIFDCADIAITWHPGTDNAVWDYSSLANVSVFFDFKGKTSHAAAAPHLGRSALDACELMNVGVNYLREHIIPEARVHYAYRDVGGIAPNVVQGTARLHYFIRAPKAYQVQEIYQRVIDCAYGAARMAGVEMSYELYAGLSDMNPNHVLSQVLDDCMREIGLPEFTEEEFAMARKYLECAPEETEAKKQAIRAQFPDSFEYMLEHPIDNTIAPLKWNGRVLPGSTDVGDASYVVPTACCDVATWTLGTPGHSWQVVSHGNTSIAHKGMLKAGEYMALCALKALEDPSIIEAAQAEWKKTLGGTYVCPIPPEVGPRLEG